MEHSPRESIYRDELSNYQQHKDQYTKETLINKLLLYLNKNSIERDLLTDPIYLEHVDVSVLHKQYVSLLKSKINRIVSKKERIDEHGYYSCYRPYMTGNWYIDRNQPKCNKWVNLNMLSNDLNTERTIRSNFWNIKDLLWVLFIRYNRLFVLRMDLYMNEDNKNDLDKLNNDFNRLLVNCLYKEDWFLKYYAVREYTERSGIHLHCYFLLDGNKVKDAFRISSLIGNRWKKLGNGGYYCRNTDSHKLPDKGEVLGKIEYWELAKIEKLIVLSKYLLKDLSERDWLERLGYNRNRRLFTCSDNPNAQTIKEEYEYYYREDPTRKYLVDYHFINLIRLSNKPSLLRKLKVHEYCRLNPLFIQRAVSQ